LKNTGGGRWSQHAQEKKGDPDYGVRYGEVDFTAASAALGGWSPRVSPHRRFSMKSTAVSLLFWIALIVVGMAIWNVSMTFERKDAQTTAATKVEGADPEARLKELGILLPKAPAPVANYVNAVRTGNLLFLAGKGPTGPDGKDVIGKLGKDLTVEQGYQAARFVAINQLAVLKAELGDLNRVTRIIKVLGMVNSDPAFTDQPAVVNGYSDLLVAVFGDKGKHARSAVGMATLPRGIAVEVEMIVEIGPVR
jgi:enamine deaminase RidA (YjgF/YER057c/UK114 family)